MALKKVLLDLLDTAQLRNLCSEFDIDADRRSSDLMRDGLARAQHATPELIISYLSVNQLRLALESYEEPTDGKKSDLVARLLATGGRYPSRQAGTIRELKARERGPDSDLLSSAEHHAGRVIQRAADGNMSQYVHGDQAVQRPDAGIQDQFTEKWPRLVGQFFMGVSEGFCPAGLGGNRRRG